MADLSEPQKLEIVSMLACFREIPVVQEHFRSEHELELTARQIGAYDPTRTYYEAGDKWRDIFDAKRKQYLEEVASVPIANQGFRLNILHEELKKAVKDGKSPLAILEQAAKEVGGVLTNQRDVRIDDNRRQRVSEMTSEDRRAVLAGVIADAMSAAAAARDAGAQSGASPGTGTVQ